MRKLFNTLYVTTQETYLSRERETIAVNLPDGSKRRFPLHNLDSIVCFGNIRISPYLIGACGDNGISISYLTEYGKFLGRFVGHVNGNVLLRREQYRSADSHDTRLDIAGNMLIGKFSNSNTVLKRFLRDNGENPHTAELQRIIEILSRKIVSIKHCDSVESLRGIEGESAALYYSMFDHLILQQKSDFQFRGRSRRPPLDAVNSLLSFLYTLIHHDISSACESVGLDPAVGYLHVDRPGRNSLALDIMEEFRAFLADRITLSLINRRQISLKDFTFHSCGAVTLSDKAKKILLETYQARKRETITHSYLQEKMQIGVLYFYQALLLSRFLRGDIDGYPPFIWR